MAGFNFGSFFGGGSNNSPLNIFSSFNFSDYNSIKNGSYRKLIKSYYAKDKVDSKSSNTDKVDSDKPAKAGYKDTTGITKMKKESDELTSSVSALNNKDLWAKKDGKYDMDKVADAVKKFASEYNDTIAQADKVNNADVSKQISNMESMTNIMSKKLSSIGVTVGTDGKLSVNEDKLKSANINDVKSLFEGSNTYGDQISKYAEDAAKAAVNGASTYSADGSLTNPLQGMFNNWV
ncbi:MAG: hypothetical protein Q4D29_06160 [Lachnospiraceae bacterium]|nr:hypothetical protein [Lachnospiraceae bacterium]